MNKVKPSRRSQFPNRRHRSMCTGKGWVNESKECDEEGVLKRRALYRLCQKKKLGKNELDALKMTRMTTLPHSTQICGRSVYSASIRNFSGTTSGERH